MATATSTADRTASEARRPEAGSRAGGVSRAERGNDGNPTGAKPRRGFDAQHDSATGHLPGGRGRPAFNARSGRIHARHRGSAANVVWPIRRSRVGGVQGRQACAAGIARRAFPWRASRRRAGIAPRGRDAKGHPATPQGRVRRRPARPAAHRAHRRSTASRRGTTGRVRSASPARHAPPPVRSG